MTSSNVIYAVFWMTGTLFSFTAMAVGGRELSSELTTFQILFFRSLVGLVIVTGFLTRQSFAVVRSHCFGLHLVRNLAHFGGQFGWFYGIAYLSLAEVFAIEFTVPVWTAILALILLKENLTPYRLTALALGLTGMVIILRPGLGIIAPASLAVLGGAVCYALSHTLTKRIIRTDTPMAVLFYMTLIQLPIGFLLSLQHWTLPGPALWPWVIVVGIAALTGHYCMARAFFLAPASVVVPMDFLRLPLIAVVGFLLYHEALDVFVFAGAIVMLTGNMINVRAEQRTGK